MTDKELVEKFEGLRLHAYPDPPGQTVRYSIGYGYNSLEITAGTVWTLQKAQDMLDSVLSQRRALVAQNVKVPLTGNQRAALVSLAYNIPAALGSDSTLVKLLNEGFTRAAADQFLLWDHVGGQVDDNLLARRKLERGIFLSSGPSLSVVQSKVSEAKPVEPAPVPVRVSVGIKGGKTLKYLPSVIAAASAGVVAVLPQIQVYLAHHPEATAIVAAIYAIISHIAPSPVQGGSK